MAALDKQIVGVGYTRLMHGLFGELMALLAERQTCAAACYLYLIRRTYGYGRERDDVEIGYAEFEEVSGCRERKVKYALRLLRERGLVRRSSERPAGAGRGRYRWRVLPVDNPVQNPVDNLCITTDRGALECPPTPQKGALECTPAGRSLKKKKLKEKEQRKRATFQELDAAMDEYAKGAYRGFIES